MQTRIQVRVLGKNAIMDLRFGRNVRRQRVAKGLIQKQLFKRLKTKDMGADEAAKYVGPSFVARVELGEGMATLETLQAFAEALGVSAAELLR